VWLGCRTAVSWVVSEAMWVVVGERLRVRVVRGVDAARAVRLQWAAVASDQSVELLVRTCLVLAVRLELTESRQLKIQSQIVNKQVNAIYKSAQRSAKPKSEAQKSVKWIGRPAENSVY